MAEVAEATDGKIRLGPGTLYGTIKRLLAAKLIEESESRPDADLDDERRRYYRLTTFGRRVIEAEVSRYADMVKVARAAGLCVGGMRGRSVVL
jgi:DNA-binding PadR family transcriptional regulator